MRNIIYSGRSNVLSTKGMAATSHPLATLEAISILKKGGNAIDAAIAASAVLSVVEPNATGIGGDCFAIIAMNGKKPISYNGSGIAPEKAKIDFFINNNHYWTFTNIGEGSGMWPFDQEFHIILNLAIGGSWGGICPIDNSSFPQEMKVDFVRVYKSVNE